MVSNDQKVLMTIITIFGIITIVIIIIIAIKYFVFIIVIVVFDVEGAWMLEISKHTTPSADFRYDSPITPQPSLFLLFFF